MAYGKQKAAIPVLHRVTSMADCPNSCPHKRYLHQISTAINPWALIGARIAFRGMSVLQNCIMWACSLRLLDAFSNWQGMENTEGTLSCPPFQDAQ